MSPEIINRICTNSKCYKTNAEQKAMPADKQDSHYRKFYAQKRPFLILHSVGCPRDSADVQAAKWDNPEGQSIAHACVDARDGKTRQTLPWDHRGWHAAQEGNDIAIGVEMAESLAIRYTGGDKFEVLDSEKARQNCTTAYEGAVALFKFLCERFGIDPLEKREYKGKMIPAIMSHAEWNKVRGVSSHTDPQHYWSGLGMPYTMDSFRQAVKAKLDGESSGSEADPGPIYRIQVGAFRNRAYAEAYLARVQEAFPQAYIKAERQ